MPPPKDSLESTDRTLVNLCPRGLITRGPNAKAGAWPALFPAGQGNSQPFAQWTGFRGVNVQGRHVYIAYFGNQPDLVWCAPENSPSQSAVLFSQPPNMKATPLEECFTLLASITQPAASNRVRLYSSFCNKALEVDKSGNGMIPNGAPMFLNHVNEAAVQDFELVTPPGQPNPVFQIQASTTTGLQTVSARLNCTVSRLLPRKQYNVLFMNSPFSTPDRATDAVGDTLTPGGITRSCTTDPTGAAAWEMDIPFGVFDPGSIDPGSRNVTVVLEENGSGNLAALTTIPGSAFRLAGR